MKQSFNAASKQLHLAVHKQLLIQRCCIAWYNTGVLYYCCCCSLLCQLQQYSSTSSTTPLVILSILVVLDSELLRRTEVVVSLSTRVGPVLLPVLRGTAYVRSPGRIAVCNRSTRRAPPVPVRALFLVLLLYAAACRLSHWNKRRKPYSSDCLFD